MNAADRRRLTPTLGVVAVVLAVLLVALWSGLGRGIRWQDRAAAARLPHADAATATVDIPPLDHFAEVWQKPVFSPTRTPEVIADGGGAASGDLVLTGVIMLPNLKLAILHDKTTGKDYRVVEGQPAGDGPALLELHPRSAVVDASGSRLQLHLVPGAAPQGEAAAQDTGAEPQPAAEAGSANAGASGMVSRRGQQEAARAAMSGTEATSPAARARALKARIEAERRRARAQHDGGG